MYHTEGRSGKQ